MTTLFSISEVNSKATLELIAKKNITARALVLMRAFLNTCYYIVHHNHSYQTP
jgi:hypothetical protein